MRRGCFHPINATMPHHKVPVANTGIEFYILFLKLFPYIEDNFSRLFSRDMPRAIVIHDRFSIRIAKGNEITSERNIRLLHIYTDTCCLKWRPSRVVEPGVVSKHAQVSDIASRRKLIGYGFHKPKDASFGNLIHVRGFCDLERGLIAKLWNRVIRHPVALKYYDFHKRRMLNAFRKYIKESPSF